ncbi:hypothetical protein [Halobacillus ihumii]|uniref:hypothetical protein n=1 Tax=Halobacillus ihumii TaxID=2686092 RepID=UPI001F08868D|nr:hypothetical protein [Halobacillus ihumii]
MAVTTNSFRNMAKQIDTDPTRRIQKIEISLEATDCGKPDDSSFSGEPKVYLTDVMLQGGTVATSWVGHVSEIQWSLGNV